MKKLKLLIFFLLVIQTVQVYGQSASVEAELKNYIKGLTENNIDTYVVLTQGCTGCEVSYNNKVISDAITYYIISKHNNSYSLQRLDGFQKYPAVALDTTSVFKMIEERKSAFEEMNVYMKAKGESEKGLKFLPPRPIHFSYTILEVNLPNFKNQIEIVNKEYDSKGYQISGKQWFEPISQIIDYVLSVVAKEK